MKFSLSNSIYFTLAKNCWCAICLLHVGKLVFHISKLYFVLRLHAPTQQLNWEVTSNLRKNVSKYLAIHFRNCWVPMWIRYRLKLNKCRKFFLLSLRKIQCFQLIVLVGICKTLFWHHNQVKLIFWERFWENSYSSVTANIRFSFLYCPMVKTFLIQKMNEQHLLNM